MRISDWSADVCSSDLTAPDGMLPWRVARATPLAPRCSGSGATTNLSVLRYTVPPAHSISGPTRRACIARAIAGQASVVSIYSDEDRQPRPCGNQSEFAIRSEEHTSELQSLMRISYAAFCLKNQNQTAAPTCPAVA